MKIYNTLSRKKENFIPLKKGHIGIYTCGPTVYWYQHVGNLRSYIFSDILRRTLEYNGYKVNHIINVTDVGHLTSDADYGEDKMEEAAQKEGKSAAVIAEYYLNIFKEDLKKLNILSPNKWPKATEHIKEQIELIKKLEKKGLTYKTNNGIYFDTSKISDYGKLARLKIEDLKIAASGAAVLSLEGKKNKTDFALWKFSRVPGKRQQEWDSPWGIGFPGWHIECSAMSIKYLGEQFDIHTGGEDHIPVHHTNEIAQSEGAYNKKPWVKYWMHGAFLTFEGGKMSKSSGKIKTISELEEQEISPLDYRYFTFLAHYRKPLTWSEEALKNSKVSLKRLKNIILEIKDDGKENKEYLKRFEKSINDDLNIPQALAILWRLVRDEKAIGKYRAIKKMDQVFGLDLLKKEELNVPKEIKNLAEERKKVRNNFDWKTSDELRDKINLLGWNIKDTKEAYVLEKLG